MADYDIDVKIKKLKIAAFIMAAIKIKMLIFWKIFNKNTKNLTLERFLKITECHIRVKIEKSKMVEQKMLFHHWKTH